ncbi:MAG: protein translocase subunit SecF [Candidatus Paceibacterota bacterium]|jgi:preprotein translocase subunit SecF|nr:protein translocase subunit SecF [Candidatus Paceibacterota bacterium]MDD4831060.1 protein translocase subunit SecF [Candidatus Paceibacterota bacterium]MDD4875318.1 protein translocase subunit SecF [Candidatus Paceibacterota bacterium]
MTIDFLKYKNFFLAVSLILVISCVALMFFWPLKPSIEFTGGAVLEIEYQDNRPGVEEIQEKIKDLGLEEVIVQQTGDKGIILRMQSASEDAHQKITEKLQETGAFEEQSFEAIGPVVGKELSQKTVLLIIVSLAAMLLYIAFAFRNVPGPVNSWIYGLASFLMLGHDVIIPLGVFAALGNFYGVQITIPIITALLTVVGYAINNVIVVYDRTRENLVKSRNLSFGEVANLSINQTLSRQINTSLAVLFPLFAIYFMSGAALKYFSLALIIGIVTGTYSSIFLATPMLVAWLNFRNRKAKKR